MGMEMVALSDLEKMAGAVSKSRLWKTVDTPEKALALMLLCQSEGLHPMTAVRRYDLIQGTPTMKAETLLAEFYRRGGAVKWIQRTAEICEAKFSHPKNCPDGVIIKWTMDDAKKAGLANKDNWKNYPRQMLCARVSSEGVQVVDPGAGLGMLTQEEMLDVQNNLADMAAQLSSDLTGSPLEVLTQLPEVPAMDDKEAKKVRAELNKALQGCSELAHFRSACKEFQSKYTKGVWVKQTGHNAIETFAMLAQEHQSRIEQEVELSGPIGVEKWIGCLDECSSVQGLASFVKQFRLEARLQNLKCEEALQSKAVDLGLSSYGDMDEVEST